MGKVKKRGKIAMVDNWAGIIIGGIMMLGAIALIAFHFVNLNRIHSYANVQAEVVGFKEKENSDGDGYLYAPIFEYEFGGVKYRRNENVYSNQVDYSIGQKVTIKINPEHPEKPITKSGSTMFLAAGSVLFAISYLLLSMQVVAPMLAKKFRYGNVGGVVGSTAIVVFTSVIFTVVYFSTAHASGAEFFKRYWWTVFVLLFGALGAIGFVYELRRLIKIERSHRRNPVEFKRLMEEEDAKLEKVAGFVDKIEKLAVKAKYGEYSHGEYENYEDKQDNKNMRNSGKNCVAACGEDMDFDEDKIIYDSRGGKSSSPRASSKKTSAAQHDNGKYSDGKNFDCGKDGAKSGNTYNAVKREDEYKNNSYKYNTSYKTSKGKNKK